MNEHTTRQITRFMGILKAMGLTKEEIFGICSLMKTEEMPWEIIQRLKAKDFKVTPQETMNICGQVIKENL
ncbi:MAG: hypothetical protein IKD04_02360 [Clostridia bacterium]|nr:hypothetical protein [Clostridia bacterium]